MAKNTYRLDVADVTQKLLNGEKLTEEELVYTAGVLIDPLQEFCKREAAFRLRSMFNLDDKSAELIEGEVEDAIRDIIDENEDLYDTIDSKIRDIIDEQKGSKVTNVGIDFSSLVKSADGVITGKCFIYTNENDEECYDVRTFMEFLGTLIIKMKGDGTDGLTEKDYLAAEKLLEKNIETNKEDYLASIKVGVYDFND